jgi:arylsulfatase
MLGDHGLWDKQVPYQPSVGVPLMLAGPGIRHGYVHHGPATTIDLMATFLDLAGVRLPRGIDSRSLRPILEGKTDEGRSCVVSSLRAWRLVYDGRYKLIRGYDFCAAGIDNQKLPKSQWAKAANKFVTLFDLQEDPLELKNVAEQQPDVVKRLSTLQP